MIQKRVSNQAGHLNKECINLKIKIITAILCFLVCCCSGSRKDNEVYLRSIAKTICAAQIAKAKLPESIDEALELSGKTLNHRGDINGNSLFYCKIGDAAFFLRSPGTNNEDEHGRGDDIQIYFVNAKDATRAEFMQYIKSKFPNLIEEYNEIIGGLEGQGDMEGQGDR